jgi:hypothetical protein
MNAELCRCPLAGRNFSAYEGQPDLAKQAKNAKAKLHLMFEVRIKLALSHFRQTDDQHTCHCVNHAILIALLMKRRIG